MNKKGSPPITEGHQRGFEGHIKSVGENPDDGTQVREIGKGPEVHLSPDMNPTFLQHHLGVEDAIRYQPGY